MFANEEKLGDVKCLLPLLGELELFCRHNDPPVSNFKRFVLLSSEIKRKSLLNSSIRNVVELQ